jgi:hypothetical protein
MLVPSRVPPVQAAQCQEASDVDAGAVDVGDLPLVIAACNRDVVVVIAAGITTALQTHLRAMMIGNGTSSVIQTCLPNSGL